MTTDKKPETPKLKLASQPPRPLKRARKRPAEDEPAQPPEPSAEPVEPPTSQVEPSAELVEPKVQVVKTGSPIILESWLSPGDIVCMTAAVRDLHINCPNRYVTEIRTSAGQIWDSNKYVTKIDRKADEVVVESEYKTKDDKGVEKKNLTDVNKVSRGIRDAWKNGKVPRVKVHYPLIHRSGKGPSHFTEGYTDYLEQILDIRIRDRMICGHIEMSNDEKSWVSQVHEITGNDDYFWIVVNGGKMDFTAKWWDPVRMQRVVSSLPNVLFAQIGQKDHYHVELHGSNVINLIGKTDMRQLIRLVYNSSGVICPVTLAMHLAAAVPVRNDKCYGRASRPCVVIAGGREPATWEAYTSHSYLHTCGQLSCCDVGGCWKSRTEPIGDGDKKDESLCLYPEPTENNIVIPKCLKMIGVEDVVHAVKGYLP